eukprot:TRINITY_DN3123_c0_g1_i1.p1 TRINITY_DN3123_c0_g1~~TRINITY_DN3123_c0_g1_i1.p1  ORF type:complete len:429 (-),score=108.54 TRINITY_DN3123_c0_g1_i1:301-1473(-)
MKVRVILERLVRRCGYDVVARGIPEQHAKLLTHIRKTKEREKRAKDKGRRPQPGEADAKGSEAGSESRSKSRASTERRSQWAHSEVFSDNDDDDMFDGQSDSDDGASTKATTTAAASRQAKSKDLSKASARSMRNRKLRTRLPEDVVTNEDEPLDLLDTERTRRVLSAPAKRRRKDEEEDAEDEIERGEDGRLVIKEEKDERWRKKPKLGSGDPGETMGDGEEDEDDDKSRDGDGGGQMSAKRKERKGPRQRPDSKTSKYKKGVLIGSKARGGKGSKGSGTGWAYTGEEYAPKKGKAGGDTKRAGKLEPHAYWPLDPKLMNRREGKRADARKGLVGIANRARKGGGRKGGSGSAVSLVAALKPKGGVKKGQHKLHKGQGKGGKGVKGGRR